MSSYYDLFGVAKDASAADIKKEYMRRIQEVHPDRLPADQKDAGEEKAKALNEAYNILKDPVKRQQYDASLNSGLPAGFNFADIFSQMMRPPQQQRITIPAVRVTYKATLEDFYNGKQCEVQITRQSRCSDCNATGHQDKKDHTCRVCNGQGTVSQIVQIGPGFMQQVSRPCTNCTNGEVEVTARCQSCKSSKFVKEPCTVKFNIAPGQQQDDIQLDQRGNEFPPEAGNGRGRVVITFEVAPHYVFKREGKNLHLSLDLTLAEAMCGFTKTFKHLDGRILAIQVDPVDDVIFDQDVKQLSGEGFPSSDGQGALIVKFKVRRDKLSVDAKKQLYEAATGTQYVNTPPTRGAIQVYFD